GAAFRFIQCGPIRRLSRGRELRDSLGGLAQRAFSAEILDARGFEGGLVRRRRNLGDSTFRERLQVFTDHRVDLLQATQSPPFVRDEGGPPRYHPCSPLVEEDARSKRYRASLGPAFLPISS